MKLNIYFAGGLFDHKELIGNKIMAEAIMRESTHFRIILPQDLEHESSRDIHIRNADLLGVAQADALIVNMDGAPLDDGTVAEFIFAKALDIPCVLFRSDFRGAGDAQHAGADPWNLMLSGWPRCERYIINALAHYEKDYEAMMASYSHIAKGLADALDKVLAAPAVLSDAQELRLAFKMQQKLCGSAFEQYLSDEKIEALIQRRLDTHARYLHSPS